MPRLRSVIVTGLAVVLLSGCGLTAPRSNDGYADLDSLGLFDVDNTLTLSIGPSLLRFAAKHSEDDPETRALLSNLEGVRVRIYEIDGNAERVAGRVDDMGARLQRQGWEPVAVLREAGETVHMLLKPVVEDDGQRIAGLTVLVADQHEAVVVNVMGDLKPEFFSDTLVALDVDVATDVQVAAVTP
ncbi:MAG: DUF4252 domain-containing protein [Xanthomonadales bacterium]|jgi:hypothetical protein|nr:DUF4252 domain-containing protein [Xanthomonadales bacterium]